MSENKVVASLPANSPPPERRGGVIGKVQAVVDRGRAFLLGYDLFISYRRADANVYALRLADRLTKLGFRCYLDQFSSPADSNLPENVKYALRQSAGLVIVGSPGVLESKAIAEEVAIFSKLSRTILPVSVAGTLKDGTWGNLIAGISRTDETKEALDKGRPSRQVLTRLSDSANFRRRNEQLKRTFLATLAAIAIVIIAGAGAAEVFRRQAAKAREQAQDALKSRDEALNGAKVAEEQRAAAVSKLNKAQGDLSRTETQLGQANTDRDNAREGARRAQEQERAARARAEEQTRLAESQHRVAVSEELAAGAAERLPTNPEASVLLARDAYEASPTEQAENVLRRSLLASHVRSIIADDEGVAQAIAFDRDGRYAATSNGADKIKIWNAVTGVRLAVLTIEESPKNDGGSGQPGSPYLSFSPDGAYVVSSTGNETAYLWKWQEESSRKQPFKLNWVKGVPGGSRCAGLVRGCETLTVAFSPDSRYIAAAGNRGVIWVWETASGTQYKFLKGHGDQVNDIEFSPGNGKYIASAGSDEQALLWDWQSPVGGDNPRILPGINNTPLSEQLPKIELPADTDPDLFRTYRYPLNGVSFDNEGRYVVAFANCNASPTDCYDKYLATVYSVDNGSVMAVLKGHESRITQASFSPDGNYVLTASYDGTARVWNWRDSNLRSKPVILRGHDGWMTSAAFSPDGRLVATGAWDGTVRLWQSGMGLEYNSKSNMLSSLTTFRGYAESTIVDEVAFSRDGKFILSTGNDGTARLWGVGLERGTAALKEIDDRDLNAAFSPDARHAVTGGSSASSLKVWELDEAGNVTGSKELRAQSGMVLKHASFSPDGRYVIAGGTEAQPDKAIWMSVPALQAIQSWDWRADDGSEKEPWIPTSPGANLDQVAFSHDAQGRYVLTAGRASTNAGAQYEVKIWDRTLPQKTPVKVVGPFESVVGSAAFSYDADSRYIAVAVAKGVYVCDWQTKGPASCIELSSQKRYDNYRDVAFSPDGKYLAAASRTINVWEWKTREGREHPLVMQSNDLNYTFFISVSFNPDSTLLITNGQDSIARLWDIRTGSLVLRLGGENFSSRLDALASFSSDGKKIIATDSAGVRIYDCRECAADPVSLLSLVGEHVSPQARMAGPSKLLQELQSRKKRAGKAGGPRR